MRQEILLLSLMVVGESVILGAMDGLTFTAYFMKRRYQLFKGTTLGTLSVLLLATACRDLESVEKFGQSSAAVKTAVALVSNDVYASCLRTARQYSLRRIQPNEDSSTSSQLPTQGNTSFPAADYFKGIQQAEKDCDGDMEHAAIIANANAILTNYVEGLGTLASGDTVKFDKNLDALEKSIQGLTGLVPNSPTEEINAGLKIARFIFNQFTLAFRRENIKEAILCANPSVGEYTEGLKFIAQVYYIDGTLRSERIAMDEYYQSLKPDTSSQAYQASERIATFLLRRQYGEELVAFADREQAARAYIEILSATAKTHNELRNVFADSKNMNEQDLKDFCTPIFTKKDSSGATGALPAPALVSPTLAESETSTPAPKALSLTPTESEAIAQILRDYQRRVEPLALDITRALGDN